MPDGGQTNVNGRMEKTKAEIVTEISQRIEELAREYQNSLPGELRREEIADEISALSFKLQMLQKSRVEG